VTLTSLIHAAPSASTQSASASAQVGKAPTVEPGVPLFGDLASFAVRLETLFAQASNPAALHAGAPAATPSSSTLPTPEITASVPTTPGIAGQAAAPANLPENATATTKPESPARNAHTVHRDHIHPQDDSTAAQPSRRPGSLRAHAAASGVESAAPFPAPVPLIAVAALQSAPLPLPLNPPADTQAGISERTSQPALSSGFAEPSSAVVPLDSFDTHAPIAGISTGSGQSLDTPTLPLRSRESAPMTDSSTPPATHAAPESDKSNHLLNALAGPLASPPPDVFETIQPPSSPTVACGAISPGSAPASHPRRFQASSPQGPSALREAPLSDRAVPASSTPVVVARTATPAPSSQDAPAAPAKTAPSKFAPIETVTVLPPQPPPSEPMVSNRAPIAAPETSSLPVASLSAGQAGAAQATAFQNLKAQPAAFRTSPKSADSGALINPFPAPATDPRGADIRSGQIEAQPAAGSFSSQNTFAALDAAAPSPSSLFTHAGARHAEAGYLDPSLGWVGIRADVSGGALHAAIVPASSQAADILGAHLPALHAYVSQQHGQESTIDMSWQHNTNTGSGFQQPSQQDQHASAGDDLKGAMAGSSPASVAQPSSFASFDGSGAPPPVPGGRYISVLA
jgi:hypothetical protein